MENGARCGRTAQGHTCSGRKGMLPARPSPGPTPGPGACACEDVRAEPKTWSRHSDSCEPLSFSLFDALGRCLLKNRADEAVAVGASSEFRGQRVAKLLGALLPWLFPAFRRSKSGPIKIISEFKSAHVVGDQDRLFQKVLIPYPLPPVPPP